jgi:hypothetical protein
MMEVAEVPVGFLRELANDFVTTEAISLSDAGLLASFFSSGVDVASTARVQ